VTRSTASLFVPFVVLIAIALGLFLKPWNHIGAGGPALPAMAPAITTESPAPALHRATKHYYAETKLSAGRLEVLLGLESKPSLTAAVTFVQLHWSCKADASGHWDYTCTLKETGSVWGYNVDSAQITSRSELSWEGHKLVP
jgi:hypothetical protein